MDTQSNIKEQGDFHPTQDADGVWNVPSAADNDSYTYANALQIDSEVDVNSDPICNSAGCTQYKHPKKDRGYDIDYPVVNLG